MSLFDYENISYLPEIEAGKLRGILRENRVEFLRCWKRLSSPGRKHSEAFFGWKIWEPEQEKVGGIICQHHLSHYLSLSLDSLSLHLPCHDCSFVGSKKKYRTWYCSQEWKDWSYPAKTTNPYTLDFCSKKNEYRTCQMSYCHIRCSPSLQFLLSVILAKISWNVSSPFLCLKL